MARCLPHLCLVLLVLTACGRPMGSRTYSGYTSWSMSSAQGVDLSGSYRHQDDQIILSGVRYDITDARLKAEDIDFGFLIFLDSNNSGMYEEGSDSALYQSLEAESDSNGAFLPEASFPPVPGYPYMIMYSIKGSELNSINGPELNFTKYDRLE